MSYWADSEELSQMKQLNRPAALNKLSKVAYGSRLSSGGASKSQSIGLKNVRSFSNNLTNLRKMNIRTKYESEVGTLK